MLKLYSHKTINLNGFETSIDIMLDERTGRISFRNENHLNLLVGELSRAYGIAPRRQIACDFENNPGEFSKEVSGFLKVNFNDADAAHTFLLRFKDALREHFPPPIYIRVWLWLVERFLTYKP